jgi:hypothetical protein
MAHVVAEAKVPLEQLEVLRFVVLAPREQIDGKIFGNRVSSQSVLANVRQRAAAYAGAKDSWCEQVVEPFLKRLNLDLLSWEEVLDTIGESDARFSAELTAFYGKCLDFNRYGKQQRSGCQVR